MTRSEIVSRVAAVTERARDRASIASLPRRLQPFHRTVAVVLDDRAYREAQVPVLPSSALLPPLP